MSSGCDGGERSPGVVGVVGEVSQEAHPHATQGRQQTMAQAPQSVGLQSPGDASDKQQCLRVMTQFIRPYLPESGTGSRTPYFPDLVTPFASRPGVLAHESTTLWEKRRLLLRPHAVARQQRRSPRSFEAEMRRLVSQTTSRSGLW